MISAAVQEQVLELTAKGMPQRKIAEVTHISRGSVASIQHRGKIRQDKISKQDFVQYNGIISRCPKCGGMVQMPCLLCKVRKWLRKRNGYKGQ